MPDTAALTEAVYAELRALAQSYMRHQRPGHTLQATALVNEAFLRLARANPDAFNDRAHFMAVAATAMRQILVNHAEAKIFGGLTHQEIADALGVSLTTVESDWRMAEAWLAKELRA